MRRGRHAGTSSRCLRSAGLGSRRGGSAVGEGEEYVVEGGLATVEIDRVDPFGIERADHFHEAGASMIGTVATRRSASKVGGFAANGASRDHGVEVAGRRDRHVDALGADARLQLGGRAVRDRAPVIEHHDVVGELIRLLEVLRVRMIVVPSGRGHARCPTGRCGCAGRARWSARRGTTPRVGDEAGGEVQPAPHAAREGLHQSRERRRGRVARAARRPPAVAPASEVVQPADHHEVLVRAHETVDRRLLGGDADPLAHGGAGCAPHRSRRRSPSPRWAATGW